MTTEIQTDTTIAIIEHHNQAIEHGQKCREHMIEAGRLLWQQKCNLDHGEWLPWIKAHLPFSARTASSYITVYKVTDELKSEAASDLSWDGSVRLSIGQEPMTIDEAEQSVKRIRHDLEEGDSALSEALPIAERFLNIRDQKTYLPEFNTLEDYLLDVGVSVEWFQSNEDLFEALVEWSQGGPATELIERLGTRSASDQTKRQPRWKKSIANSEGKNAPASKQKAKPYAAE